MCAKCGVGRTAFIYEMALAHGHPGCLQKVVDQGMHRFAEFHVHDRFVVRSPSIVSMMQRHLHLDIFTWMVGQIARGLPQYWLLWQYHAYAAPGWDLGAVRVRQYLCLTNFDELWGHAVVAGDIRRLRRLWREGVPSQELLERGLHLAALYGTPKSLRWLKKKGACNFRAVLGAMTSDPRVQECQRLLREWAKE